MFLQHLFSAKRRVLLLYLLVISIPIVYYITSRVIEVRNNKLLIKYSELSYHLQQHSIMAKKIKHKKTIKKSDPIDIEINKSFKNKNIIFTVSLLDGGKCFVEINSAKFSNLLDAIIDVSNKYDINVSSADIYLHQDDDDGYVAGKIIFFK
ncbi:hypothetical protein [Yersinia pestis]|uniref:hypothetical protein n=1 Tax=Yersinia pestis TaxID=632 RepID=UPI000D5828DD|nr:hypothetical protein [Yersinia pestis]PVT94393.1 hypothetical protein A8V44_16505 [Yersinia pestis]